MNMNMKQCAIVLEGEHNVVKVVNLKRKFSKIENNPNMKILEECDLEDLEDKYNYWNRTLNRKQEEQQESCLKYHFKNPKTGYTITSIYPTLDNLKGIIKDIDDYEKVV